jgi:hypothetical protein
MTHITTSEYTEYEKICVSDLPNLKLDIDVPWRDLYDEIEPLLDQFVDHRNNVGDGLWKSLTLHGTDMYTTQNKNTVTYDWTTLADFCPIAHNYFLNEFPCATRRRLRYMLLEPNGIIDWHTDAENNNMTAAVNIALNNPKECLFFQGRGDEYIPWEAGDARLINTVYGHRVSNLSTERRVHFIFHGGMFSQDPDWIKMVLRSHEKYGKDVPLKRLKKGVGNRHSNVEEIFKELNGSTVSSRM